MRIRILILFILTATHFSGYSQTYTPETNSEDISNPDKTSFGIITGWHQWKYGFGEIGVGVAKSDWGNHGNMFHAVSFSLDLNPWANISGYKVSIWKNIPFVPLSLGMSGVRYRSNDRTDWTIRPMIGCGLENLHLTYSYDIRLGSREIRERNSHMFSLRYFIPIVKLKTYSIFK